VGFTFKRELAVTAQCFQQKPESSLGLAPGRGVH
jgi:hypothetical protein